MYSFIVLMALAAPPQSPTGQFDKYDLDNLPPVPPIAEADAPKTTKRVPLPPSTTYQTDEINRTRAWIKGQLQNKGRLNRTMDKIVNEADAKKLQRMATNLALYNYYYKPSYNTYWKPITNVCAVFSNSRWNGDLALSKA